MRIKSKIVYYPYFDEVEVLSLTTDKLTGEIIANIGDKGCVKLSEVEIIKK